MTCHSSLSRHLDAVQSTPVRENCSTKQLRSHLAHNSMLGSHNLQTKHCEEALCKLDADISRQGKSQRYVERQKMEAYNGR